MLWCLVIALVPAEATAAWTEPELISASGVSAREPEVAVDGSGNLTAVWQSGSSPNQSIESAYRPAGGPWGAPDTLIQASLNCTDPRLAENPEGAAVVMADCGTGTAFMWSAYRPAGGAWGSELPVPASGSSKDPRVAIDDSGNANAVWETTANTVESSYRPAAGNWAAGVRVSPSGDYAVDPQIAVSPTGRALAIWRHELRRSVGDPVITVETTSRQGSGAWNATPQVLTPPATSTVPVAADEPEVTWNRAGNRFAVWSNFTTPALPVLQSRWGSGGDFGSWGADFVNRTASDGSRSVEVPQVALDDQGRAIAAWRSINGGGQFRTQVATTGFINDTWSAPVTLNPGVETGLAEPQVVVDGAGDATVGWRNLDSTFSAVSRPAGAGLGPVITVSSHDFDNPQLAIDDSGDTIGTWSDTSDGGLRAAVAVDDVTAPAVAPVHVPSAATTGSPVAMSATATDTFSPTSLVWHFGDGSTASGAAVSHTYATPGNRTVTVTATDAVGNSTTESRQIAVTEPDGPEAVTLSVSVPRQSWRKIRKARGIRLRCTIDAVGRCDARATVTARVARRLGLEPQVGSREAVAIGAGTGSVTEAGGTALVRVKLARKARAAIGRATKSVRLKLAVTGSAATRTPATAVKKFKIRR